MSDNVGVTPSTDGSAVSIATDDVSNVHYPIYKLAVGGDGEATLASDIKGLPVQLAKVDRVQQDSILQTMQQVEKQMKIMNIHLAILTGEQVTKGDV